MGLRQRVRYRFDNLMAHGVGAQILLLAAVTAVLIAILVVLLFAFGASPVDDQGVHASLGKTVWRTLNHTLDTGNLGGDTGSWTFLFIMLFATLGGLFVVSTLVGVLNQGFGAMLESLRRGKSVVVEREHTVILGWSPKVFTLLRELAEANRNQRGACVVILAERDKVAMDAEVSRALGRGPLRVVTRTGNPMTIPDLGLVALADSKAVVVLAPEQHADGTALAPHESDTIVLKVLLAIGKVAPIADLHVVAELFDERSEQVARLVAGAKAALIPSAPLISRLLVQTGRQSGLSAVYSELLDFAGVEIYLAREPRLAGKTFREAVFAYGTSTLLGVRTAAGELLLPPSFDRPLAADDEIIAISEDDDTLVLDGKPGFDETAIETAAPPAAAKPERTLVLGTSPRLPSVLRELDSYVVSGSETIVYGEQPAEVPAGLSNMHVRIHQADVTNRTLLDKLELSGFDHVLVLSETDGRTQEMADARTTVTLLFLRDVERRSGRRVPITSEILDIHNRDLAAVAEADDFIVSNTLVSLLVAQVAENRHLIEVFDELFTAGGYELYLKPATAYVKPGEATFATVTEAALRRDEIAIGYRRAALARDPGQGFGVVVNPGKQQRLRFEADDSIIVMARD